MAIYKVPFNSIDTNGEAILTINYSSLRLNSSTFIGVFPYIIHNSFIPLSVKLGTENYQTAEIRVYNHANRNPSGNGTAVGIVLYK